jgi:ribosomal protein S27E
MRETSWSDYPSGDCKECGRVTGVFVETDYGIVCEFCAELINELEGDN